MKYPGLNFPISSSLLLILTAACSRHADPERKPAFSEGQWRIILRWQTETESNTFGYFVHRAESEQGEMICLNADAPIHAQGNSTIPMKYVYFDLSVKPGKTYFYKLQSKDLDGTSEWIVGADIPVAATAKPLSASEAGELKTKGQAYREEAP